MPLDRGVLLALETGTKPLRILATDDRPEILGVIERTLRERFECLLAGSVGEARKQLERSPVDLAICDVEMPGESGLVLVEEIAARWPLTAVMLLTGIDDIATAERGFQLGANGYLVKPFSSGQLLISSMIALHQRQLELAQETHMRTLQSRIQDLMDRAPIPIYIKDKSLRYTVANRAATELLGFEPGALAGHSDEEFLPPDAEAVSREVDKRILEHGGTFEGEAKIMIGGEERTFLSVKFPYVNDDGEIIGVSGIATDISEQKRAERLERKFSQEQMRAVEGLRRSRLETVERLARAIEFRDGATGEHVNRMARVAAMLGQQIGLETEQIELLRAAAPMHDVGKIATPDEILRKPGALSTEEFEVMKQHTTVGHEILTGSDSPLLQMAARIALTHHERYDGNGYPRGLKSEEIPIEGRIVAVADAFDALLSDRVYRPAMSIEATARLIRSESGTHFDPTIASLLLDNIDEARARRG